MNKEKVFGAVMELIADGGWNDLTFSELAGSQKIQEAELESQFKDKTGSLPAFSEFIDELTLEGLDSDVFDPEIPVRERLLEILLVRFDVLAPYKNGVRELLRVTAQDPKMFVIAAKAIRISMRSSLETVGNSTQGIKGIIKIKGLTAVFLLGMRAWCTEGNRDTTVTTRSLDDRLKWAESLALSIGLADEKMNKMNSATERQ